MLLAAATVLEQIECSLQRTGTRRRACSACCHYMHGVYATAHRFCMAVAAVQIISQIDVIQFSYIAALRTDALCCKAAALAPGTAACHFDTHHMMRRPIALSVDCQCDQDNVLVFC